MSDENVELVRFIHEGWSRGDFGAGADLLAPDYSWEQHPEAVEAGSRPAADVGRTLMNIFDVYDDYRVEADEFIDAGDQVVVAVRARGTGKASRMELDQGFVLVWTLKGGLLSRLRVFTSRKQAMEAAGLRE